MKRLLLSFALLSVLLLSVLAYFIKSSYLEERDLLVERINNALDADERRGLERIIVKYKNPVIGDSVSLSEDGPGRWINEVFPNSVRIITSDDLAGNDREELINLGTLSVGEGGLDSIGTAFGVSLLRFDSTDALHRAGAIPLQDSLSTLRKSIMSRDREHLGVIGYRSVVIKNIGYEIAFTALLLFATGFAFYSAFRSLAEQHLQLRQRDTLLANVAHELKTPIAAVGVALEALEHFGADDHPTKRREYLNLSRAELGRLDELADRALTGLRGGSLAERLTYQTVDMEALTLEVWRSLGLAYGIGDECLRIEVIESHLPTLRGDKHYLYVCIQNLLENAVKYGGDPPRVMVTIYDDGSRLDYTVSDNGPGISRWERDRIFERFYRGSHTAAGHRVKGHGLGLSLVKQVIQAHGGTVGAGTHATGGGWVGFEIPRS